MSDFKALRRIYAEDAFMGVPSLSGGVVISRMLQFRGHHSTDFLGLLNRPKVHATQNPMPYLSKFTGL